MRKKSILLNRLYLQNQYEGKYTVGIIGIHEGAGATHTCLLLAHYFSEWLNKKTILLECGSQNEIRYLNDNVDTQPSSCFNYGPICVYPNIKEKDMSTIIGGKYQCAILDLGTDYTKAQNEFLRCNKKIIVASQADWKTYKLERFMNTYKVGDDNITFIIPFLEGKKAKQLSKVYGVNFIGLPYEPKLDVLSAKSLEVLHKLFII